MSIIKWLDRRLEEYLLILLSSFTVIVIFSQVVMRYVMQNSLVWSEEIARYAFIWMIYIGVSYAIKQDKHIRTDALTLLFKDKGKIILAIIGNVLFLIFAIVLTVYGFEIVTRITRMSPALEIPLSWVYAAPVVGLGLSVIRLVQQLIKQFRQLKNSGQSGLETNETETQDSQAKERVL